MESFDWIIVGAGSAGCVLANRLTACGRHRVLLLEAGADARTPYVRVPAAIIQLIGNSRYDWGFAVDPDPSRGGRRDYWPAGRLVGGSSAINGMLYVRGGAADFDRWAAMGNVGWAFADVAPYFRRLEACRFPVSAMRGTDGPQRISHLRSVHPLAAPFLAAAEAAGFPRNPDYNADR